MVYAPLDVAVQIKKNGKQQDIYNIDRLVKKVTFENILPYGLELLFTNKTPRPFYVNPFSEGSFSAKQLSIKDNSGLHLNIFDSDSTLVCQINNASEESASFYLIENNAGEKIVKLPLRYVDGRDTPGISAYNQKTDLTPNGVRTNPDVKILFGRIPSGLEKQQTCEDWWNVLEPHVEAEISLEFILR